MSRYYRGRDYDDSQLSRSLKIDGSLLKSLWQLAFPVRVLLGVAFVLIVLAASADLTRPYLMKLAIDQYIQVGDMTGLDRLFFLYLATIFASLVLSYFESLALQKAGQRVILTIREQIFCSRTV